MVTERNDHHRYQTDPALNLALQTLWEIRGILGFDNDSMPDPGATIAGMGIDGFCEMMIKAAREHRQDVEDAYEEFYAADEALQNCSQAYSDLTQMYERTRGMPRSDV